MLPSVQSDDHDSSTFIPVSNRAKKRRKNQPYRAETLSLEEQVVRVRSTLASRRRALQDDADWYTALTGQIRQIGELFHPLSLTPVPDDLSGKTAVDPASAPPMKMLCLGLGKISESREAQVQYVLLQDLVSGLRVLPIQVELFDPMFTAVDRELIQQDGYNLLTENKCGSHTLDPDIPTLAYLPHFPRDLYEAFLRTNWDRESFVPASPAVEAESPPDEQVDNLVVGKKETCQDSKTKLLNQGKGKRVGRCVMLANDFKDYCVSVPSRKLQDESPCIARLAPRLTSRPLIPLPTNHLAHNAFSSLCYQYLDRESLDKIDWSMPSVKHEKSGDGSEEMLDGIGSMVGDRNDVAGRMANVKI